MATTSVQTLPTEKVHLLKDDQVLPFQEVSAKDVEPLDMAPRILEVIFKYRMTKNTGQEDKTSEGYPAFLATIQNFVRDNKTVRMCLPAFPFKSANKAVKVLGNLPDFAEEVALTRLNELCAEIESIYKPGAKLVIISDGLVYNDLLSVPDREVWSYGESLRAMTQEKNFNHIEFAAFKDLVSFQFPDQLDEMTYVANATNFRHALFNDYGKPDLDIEQEIAENEDTLMTYCGYKRFLESDLKQIYPVGGNRSNRKYKNDVSFLAKQMLIRGHAFSGSVKANFGDHVRLSIHQSTGQNKISVGLLPTGMTPWHCCVGVLADGTLLSGTRTDFEEDEKFEKEFDDERPVCFKEKDSESD